MRHHEDSRCLLRLAVAGDLEFIQSQDDIVAGGCVVSPDSPARVCIVCRWPMENRWTAFDGPLGEFDSFQRPLDQALAEYGADGR